MFKLTLAVIIYAGILVSFALSKLGLSDPLVALIGGGGTLIVLLRYIYSVLKAYN